MIVNNGIKRMGGYQDTMRIKRHVVRNIECMYDSNKCSQFAHNCNDVHMF